MSARSDHGAAYRYITRRLADEPTLSTNRLQAELRASGIGIRRQTLQGIARDVARELGIAGRPTQVHPTVFGRRGTAKHRDAASVLSLARRDYGGQLEPARRAFNQANPDRAISQAAMKKYAPATIEKRGGRWHVKAYDRLPRTTEAITTEGRQFFIIKDSRTASLIARHANAVDAYLRGEMDALDTFRAELRKEGRKLEFTVDGHKYKLEFNPDKLRQLAEAGELEAMQIGT